MFDEEMSDFYAKHEKIQTFIVRRLQSLTTMRTLWWFFIYVFMAFLMALVQQLSDELAPFSCEKFDALFYLLPDLSQYGILIDMMANFSPFLMCILIVFFGSGDPGLALRRWFALMTMLYFMRSLCLIGTMEPGLPKSDLRYNIGGNKIIGALKIVTLTSHSYTDLMFSGHTCSLILAFVLYLESKNVDKRVTIAFALYLFVGIIGLGFCRLHYTNDCVVAAFLTLLLYRCYSDAAKNNKYRIIEWIDMRENGVNKK